MGTHNTDCAHYEDHERRSERKYYIQLFFFFFATPSIPRCFFLTFLQDDMRVSAERELKVK